MSERVDLQEFVGGFVAEADELIAAANAALLDIETGNDTQQPRPRAVRDLFRALHTIKGLAAMIGVEPIVEISHALETVVRIADKGGGRFTSPSVQVTIKAVRAIAERVRAVAEGRPPAGVPAGLLDAIANADSAPEAAAVPPPMSATWDSRLSPGERQQVFQALRGGGHVYGLVFHPSAELARDNINIGTVRAKLAEVGELIKVVPRSLAPAGRGVVFDILIASSVSPAEVAELAAMPVAEVTTIELPVEREAAPVDMSPVDDDELPAPSTSHAGRSLVRVELSRLDDLQEQLSLLVASRFRLERELAAMTERGVDVRRLREIIDLQSRQLRGLRRAILAARMIRVTEVLEPLSLLVRSLVRPGVKEVKLEVDARDTELDKAVADRLLPAIIHLVRNAIDHAIEPIDERVGKGKSRAGTLRVTCIETSTNQVELVITDDGRGIDRPAVARKSGRNVDSDDDLLDVITTPGFSTRTTATETSGRGLGMDIVKRIAVDQLGGHLLVTTERDVGTSFTLRVPVTIAIMDVFSFSCGSQSFVVPVSAIEEIFELDAGERVTPGGTSGVTLLERRGRAMSVVSLGAVLAIDNGASANKALVVRRNGEPVAFAVDRMLGRQEVVVRPIEDPIAHVPGVSGATDLGDGRPTLVLDLGELTGKIARRERGV